MSNRTLVELNHDFAPRLGDLAEWAQAIRSYLHSGDKADLPNGVTFIEMHHHSEPSVIEKLQRELDAANRRIKELENEIAINSEAPEYASWCGRQLEAAERKLATALDALKHYARSDNWVGDKYRGTIHGPSVAQVALAQIEQPQSTPPFKCRRCGKEFATEADYDAH